MRTLIHTAVVFLVGSALCSPCLATITHSSISEDVRPIIEVAETFAFGPGGKLQFTLTGISVPAGANVNRMGLFLSDMDGLGIMADAITVDDTGSTPPPVCVLDDLTYAGAAFGSILLRFSDFGVKQATGPQPKTPQAGPYDFAMGSSNALPLGQYVLYFANCEGVPVTFELDVEEFNVDSSGNRSYLSVGQAEILVVYWVMFGVFLSLTVAWCVLLWLRRAHAHRIHLLMGALGLARSLTLMSQALVTANVEHTGGAEGWDTVYYTFTFLRGTLFFVVIILIGTGWSYMKPFLSDRDKHILMFVIPLQVFANLAAIIVGENSPALTGWFTWQDLFHIVDIVCCGAVLFPIMWSIQNLKEASRSDGKAAVNLQKLLLFRQFYVVLVAYIYFSRFAVPLLASILPYSLTFVAEIMNQVAAVALYVWVAVSFRPRSANPYLRLDTDDDEGDKQAQVQMQEL